MPTFEYTVDGEPQSTNEHELTPNLILTSAGIDPQKNYLVQIEGDNRISYKDKGTAPIHMHNNMKFVSVELGGPVPLSKK